MQNWHSFFSLIGSFGVLTTLAFAAEVQSSDGQNPPADALAPVGVMQTDDAAESQGPEVYESAESKKSSAKKVAAEIDQLITAELNRAGVPIAELCNDEDFLRRASLDLIGKLPTPDEIREFRANNDPDKRSSQIDALLTSSEFGLNWARYWRDVIYFRAIEQRSRFNQEEFTKWLANEWNREAGWNSTVTAMLTAVGNVEEHPETALIFAQGANTEDVAAEACRVFLGIQLQCANCHDHPSDIWKREQFHQLAAYFPRITERRVMKGKPEFEIVSVNTENRRADLLRDHPDFFVMQFDRNKDQKVSREELEKGPKRIGKKLAVAMSLRANPENGSTDESMKRDDAEEPMEKSPQKTGKKLAAAMKQQGGEMQENASQNPRMKPPLAATKLAPKVIDRLFETGDTNKDGLLTVEEIRAAQPPVNRRKGRTEHHMANLLNPESEGAVVDPKFFVDGATLPHGLTDEERRKAVAQSFTSPENPWFARAIVNRIWAEMLGEGFYMPIDDLGPTRAARYPQVLDLLCQNFIENGYDPKWLVRTIANTAAYQRKIRVKSANESELPFASATPVPLRSDVVFNSLATVFDLNEAQMGGRNAKPKPAKENPRAFLQSPRYQFDALFGNDPSVPKDEVSGNIPQSLMMMNSRVFRAGMSAKGQTRLSRILKEHKDNSAALTELYLVTLSREPSESEREICTKYIADVKSRPEAFEDLMWSLLNSSEFISRR